jgi:hypothetical protein
MLEGRHSWVSSHCILDILSCIYDYALYIYTSELQRRLVGKTAVVYTFMPIT